MSRTNKPLAVYVHIPFCRRKCTYCDFLSTGGASRVPDAYVKAVLTEWSAWAAQLGQESYELASIYLGGGTPSLLEPDHVARLVAAIREVVSTASDCEVTLEGNPDSLTSGKLRGFVDAGINRLSIGVQSFNDQALHVLGRLHDAHGAERAVLEARQAGIRNLSLDLMYGLPGFEPGDEISSLRHAIELEADHISWYNLTLAAGTPLAGSVAEGRLAMPDDDIVLTTMREGWAMLEDSGYQHYEISNFALPGFASRHNLAYWLSTDYVGLGLGASGYVGGRRWTNVDSMDAYEAAVLRKTFPFAFEESLSGRRREGEYVILRLRLPRMGLEFAAFARRFNEDARTVFGSELARLAEEGLLVISDERAVCTPKGLELNNLVAEAFV